jgi:protein-L-isoaspartate(D-aspartate) O-methyltransferase
MTEAAARRDDPASLRARQALVAEIEADVRRFGAGDGTFALDPQIREVLLRVPREHFVAGADVDLAYANRPLPIGHGQTISQPLVVALMTQHLHLGPGARVLEVGTGSGYQTAILAELADEVVTIEVVAPLADSARRKLEALGYTNIAFRIGDGGAGAPDLAPFDAIIVTAAARTVPGALLDQLQPGGRMVIPVGESPGSQLLLLLTKRKDGHIDRQTLFPVAFVPLTGGQLRD